MASFVLLAKKQRGFEPRAVVHRASSSGTALLLGIKEGLIGNDGDAMPLHIATEKYDLSGLRRLYADGVPKLPRNYQALRRNLRRPSPDDQILLIFPKWKPPTDTPPA